LLLIHFYKPTPRIPTALAVGGIEEYILITVVAQNGHIALLVVQNILLQFLQRIYSAIFKTLFSSQTSIQTNFS
jgi:hypothetical protein